MRLETQALIEEYREEVLECVHEGMACVVGPEGVRKAIGDPNWRCFYRSCSKPIQALPIIQLELDRKYGLTEEEAAIFSASHWGDPYHVGLLERVMEKTGLREEQMIMLPTYPNRPEAAEALMLAGKPRRKIYHNCSGKHLGMMLLQRELGGKTEDYWRRDSLAQHEILRAIEGMTDVPAGEISVGVDGCGVPVYAVPFHAIATSFLRLQCPELIADDALAEAARRNAAMIHRYPNTIAGENVVCSILASDPDLLGKSGAKGVYVLASRSRQVGVVAKIMDGSNDEFGSIALYICRQLGCSDLVMEELEKAYPDVVINDNREVVGQKHCAFSLD